MTRTLPAPSVSWSPPNSARSWWDALANDSAVGVQVCSARTAQILYVNDLFSRWFGVSASEAIGRHIGDFLPKSAADERIAIIRLAQQSQRPVVVNDMWNGVALRIVARPLYAPGEGPEEVLVTLRTQSSLNAEPPAPADAHIVTPRHVDKGPLAALSPRETEVFRLLASGLTCSQIAARLERSLKTIHRHREAIGRKLGLSNRLDLIRLAELAGMGGREHLNGN